MSATTTKRESHCLSEDERSRQLETRVLNRVKAWDEKAEWRRHHLVELLRDRIELIWDWAPDGQPPEDQNLRRLFARYREEMYGYWLELEAIGARDGR